MARNLTHRTYECGCWYELLEVDGEVVTLRLVTCSVCMSLAFMELERLSQVGTLQGTLPFQATGAAEDPS